MKKIVSILLTVIMIVGIAATTASAEETTKDTLRVSVTSEPQTLDPAGIGQNIDTGVGMYTVYETLLTEKNGDSLTIEPLLAESYEMSEDGKAITFHLRQGVKFHNGETMTADDVVFSFNRAIASSKTSSITGSMDHMDKIDDNTVVLYLKYSYLPILQCVANYNLSIVNQKAVEEAGSEYARNPVGTAAYKLVSWDSGSVLRFERFDDYWREPANFKYLELVIHSDTSTAAIALENNEIDILWKPSASDYMHLENLDNVQVMTCSGVSYLHIFFNCSNESSPFSNVLVRRAVAKVVDRDDVIIVATEGTAVPLECLVPSTLAGYDPDFRFWEKDVEGAKALLAEAGYPNGFEATIKLSTGSSEGIKAATVLQDELREIGIILNVEKLEKATWDEEVRMNADYEISIAKFQAHYQDADYILHHRLTSYVINNLSNFYGVTSDRIDWVLDQARYSTDQEERNKLYSEVFEYVKDNCCIIPLYEPTVYTAANSHITGYYAHPSQRMYLYYVGWEE